MYWTFLEWLGNHWLLILLVAYAAIWFVVGFAIMVSKKAREYFGEFFPAWFNRNGRPFTTKEKIGAGMQILTVLIIIWLLTL